MKHLQNPREKTYGCGARTRSTDLRGDRTNAYDSADLSPKNAHSGAPRSRNPQRLGPATRISSRRLQQSPPSQLDPDESERDYCSQVAGADLSGRAADFFRQSHRMGQALHQSETSRCSYARELAITPKSLGPQFPLFRYATLSSLVVGSRNVSSTRSGFLNCPLSCGGCAARASFRSSATGSTAVCERSCRRPVLTLAA